MSLFAVSCVSNPDDIDTPAGKHNLSIETKASLEDVMSKMRLFTFHKNGANAGYYSSSLYSTYTGNTVKATVQTGDWNLAMVAPPSWSYIISPDGGIAADQLPLYKYEPTLVSNKSSDSPEIYTAYVTNLPTITPDGNHSVSDVKVARNVAKVELLVSEALGNFKLNGNHKIELGNVPSTISYAGTLIPNKDNPTMLANPLEGKLTLTQASGAYKSDTVTFIIPAHKGSDFLEPTPADVIGKKMTVTLTLERIDGSLKTFVTQEVPVVALCNRILNISIKASDGMELVTKIDPWNEVTLSEIVGDNFPGWIYVKQGSTGNGESWSSPLGSVAAAITLADRLDAAGYTVHGILIAGGSSYTYNESFSVNHNMYGGWAGTAGTELPDNHEAPYTSADRNLRNYKVSVKLPAGGGVSVGDAIFDGFIVESVNNQNGNSSGMLSGTSGARINAVAVQNNSSGAASPINLAAGATASNILVQGNAAGIKLDGATLVNATVVNNTGSSTIANSTVVNSIFWHNSLTFSGTNDIEYCAFEGTKEYVATLGGARNLHINNNNTAWFTTMNPIPGPHFNLTADASRPAYMAMSTSPDNNRAPMLGHGKQAMIDQHTPFIPDGYRKDIDGNDRYWRAAQTEPGSQDVPDMDMGCYEHDSNNSGFSMRWATDKVFVSSKGGYASEVPLLIPGNDKYQIGVAWTVSIIGTLNYTTFQGPTSGTGNEVLVGSVNFQNSGTTPTNDYTGNVARQCGTLEISTDLGGYLPNATFEVWQTPGASAVWNTGYCGSFHRNDERGARYITGPNVYYTSSAGGSGAQYAYWSARVISGLDWIKIDGGNIDDGDDINYDANHPDYPGEVEQKPSYLGGGYYKEVTDTYGGVVSGEGYIRFRVGMKSRNTTGKPRYGVIVISRGNQPGGDGGGGAMFFVRQGEDADYLYRPEDPRTSGTPSGRPDVKKWSPYSVTDPDKHTTNITATNRTQFTRGKNGGEFADFPTQVGYFYQRNRTVPYLRGAQTTSLPTTTPDAIGGTGTSSVPTGVVWDTDHEICPPGYRHPKILELIQSLYMDVGYTQTQTGSVSPQVAEVLRNFVWGRYADGYYDQLAGDVQLASNWNTASANIAGQDAVGTPPYQAIGGIMMVNHYNYGSLFFPSTSTMVSSSPSAYGQTYSTQYSSTIAGSVPIVTQTASTVMFPVSDWIAGSGSGCLRNTHWVCGHVGIACTGLAFSYGSNIRCVKDEQ